MRTSSSLSLLLFIALGQLGCVHPTSSPLAADTQTAASYLALKRRVTEIAENDRKIVRQEAMNRHRTAPTSSNQIRLAIVLSGPGASNKDRELARGALLELLEDGTELTLAERDFVQISVFEIEQSIAMQRQITDYKRRLRDLEVQSTLSVRNNRQLEAEIDRIGGELSDLRRKIRDLTYIEQSIQDSNEEIPP